MGVIHGDHVFSVCHCLLLAEPNNTIDERICLGQDAEEIEDAEKTINDVMKKLLSETANNSYNFEWNEALGRHDTRGNAACNSVIPHDDCVKCLDITEEDFIEQCPFKSGEHIKRRDCRFTFKQYEFHSNW